MKITSLFTRIPHVPSKIDPEKNNDNTPDSKLFSSPVSSPDIILPSPLSNKKKSVKAKRSLNKDLVDIELEKSKNPPIVSDSLFPPITYLNLTTDCTTNPKEDDQHDQQNYIDSQSYNSTESLASTITCDESDYYSDLYFDDWNECSSSVSK